MMTLTFTMEPSITKIVGALGNPTTPAFNVHPFSVKWDQFENRDFKGVSVVPAEHGTKHISKTFESCKKTNRAF